MKILISRADLVFEPPEFVTYLPGWDTKVQNLMTSLKSTEAHNNKHDNYIMEVMNPIVVWMTMLPRLHLHYNLDNDTVYCIIIKGLKIHRYHQ